MYAWNLPYCEVLTLALCPTSLCKKVDLKLHLISASSCVHTKKISGLSCTIKLQGMSVFPCQLSYSSCLVGVLGPP